VKPIRLVSSALLMSALVFTLASCGKSSSVVAPAGVTLDTTPPAAPTNLSGSYDDVASRDYLNWTGSTSSDVASYQVWQYDSDPASGSPTGRLIATAGATDESVALPPTSDDGTHWFRVRAVDGAGNQSAYSVAAAADLHAWNGTGAPGNRGIDNMN
jgi:hypothetical protein